MTKRTKSSQLWLRRQTARSLCEEGGRPEISVRARTSSSQQLDGRFRLLRRDRRSCSSSAPRRADGRAIWRQPRAARSDRRGGLSADAGAARRDVPVLRHRVRRTRRCGERTLSGASKVDLVLSDMAPNISGVKATDQAAAMELVDLATDTAIAMAGTGRRTWWSRCSRVRHRRMDQRRASRCFRR